MIGDSIRVSTSGLDENINTINAAMQSLEEAINAAKNAGQAAISAAGGETTGVGAAISSVIVDVDMAKLLVVKTQLEDMLKSLSSVSSKYAAVNQSLISKIKALAANENGNSDTTI